MIVLLIGGNTLIVFAVVRPVEKALETIAYVHIRFQCLRVYNVRSAMRVDWGGALCVGGRMEIGRRLLLLSEYIARTHCVYMVAAEGVDTLEG